MEMRYDKIKRLRSDGQRWKVKQIENRKRRVRSGIAGAKISLRKEEASKGNRRNTREREPKKDVASCEKLR